LICGGAGTAETTAAEHAGRYFMSSSSCLTSALICSAGTAETMAIWSPYCFSWDAQTSYSFSFHL